MVRWTVRWAAIVLVGALVSSPALAQTPGRPERTKVILASGGRDCLCFLPVEVAEALGYFRETGINVEIQGLAGGGQALRTLLAGAADVVTGGFDHTIQAQAAGRVITAFVLEGRYAGVVFGISRRAAQAGLKTYAGLRGRKIGVTAPGSSTDLIAGFLMDKAGVGASDYSTIPIGVTATAVAAVRSGQVDAAALLEPAASLLESTNDIVILADTRTTAGTLATFGGPYPLGVMYATPEFIEHNPNVIQLLTTAVVRALMWMQSRKSADEIVAVLPQEYYANNKRIYTIAVERLRESFSPDGRISPEGAENMLKVLSHGTPSIAKAKIDLSKTYDNRFVEKALKVLSQAK